MRKTITLLTAFAGLQAFAGGFQLNVQSVRAVGMGGAFTGFARDASSVFFNPAGLTNISGHQFMFGGNLVFPKVSLQTAANDNINQTSGLSTPIHFYYGGQITDKLFVGFGVNNPFGSSSSFADDWDGRYIVQNISLKTFCFQPSMAYKLHDKLSLGAGFSLTTGSFSYEKAVPVSSSTTDYGKASLSGSGIGYGYNVGLFANNLIDSDKLKLDLGIDFRSGQSIQLDNGTAQFTNIPPSLTTTFPSETNFSGGLNLPYVLSTGLAIDYALNESNKLTLVYDLNLTGWSSYDTLAFDFENEDTPDSKTPKNWENSFTHRVGLEYAFNDMIFVRGGLYYDITPIPDGFVSPELPDATQLVPTLGFGVKLADAFTFDLSWIHQNTTRSASLDDAGFSADYHRIADVVSFSVSYTF